MRDLRPAAVPSIVSLPNIDFWYWCRHFIDFTRSCSYGCAYCNTQRPPARKGGGRPAAGLPAGSRPTAVPAASGEGPRPLPGLRVERGLPREKETIGLGLLSEPLQPDNGEVRFVLRSLYDAGYPVNIVTKCGMNSGIADHVDLFKRFARRDFIRITFTILTLDETLSRELEGGSPSPMERMEALGALRREGIPAGVALTPLIPRVNDDRDMLSDLVRAAKERGAGWFLFSGFDPVRAFLQDPRWSETASLHADTEGLRERYRVLKRTLLDLLTDANLPIRVPRITLNLFRQRSSIALVSEYLFNISYLYELMERDVEMMRYRRAAYELSRNPVPLRTLLAGGKLGHVRGVNPDMERVIEEILNTETSSFYASLREQVAGA